MSNRAPFFRLYERTSAKGNPYLAGRQPARHAPVQQPVPRRETPLAERHRLARQAQTMTGRGKAPAADDEPFPDDTDSAIADLKALGGRR